MKFRILKAEEIDVRIGSVKEGKGASLLLYKDARCDMNILDDTVGAMNWQRKHIRDNHNCIVSIWDSEKSQWIEKEDTGTESNAEKAKGLASDSFKRACFNWGIGRELYTSPFIWVSNDNKYEKYTCSHIKVVAGKITELGIKDKKGNSVFNWIDKNTNEISKEQYNTIHSLIKEKTNLDKSIISKVDHILKSAGYSKLRDINKNKFASILEAIKKL